MKPISITLNQIRFVLAVAEEGSTSAAARRLNISQPSISLAITSFEKALGFPLFLRRPGLGMEPTAQGARKLVELRTVYQQMTAVLTASDEAQEVSGDLSIGFMTTLGPRYVPAIVQALLARHPGIRIKLHEGDLQSLSSWLETGRVEVALLYDFALPSDLDLFVLKEIDPYGLVWKDHPLAGRQKVSISELLDDPLILINLPGSREFFLSLLQGHETQARIAFETGSVEFLRSAVANGLGVGLLATELPYDTTYDGKHIVRLPLKGPLPPHRVSLARHPAFAETSLFRAFRQICIDHFGVPDRAATGPESPATITKAQ